MTALRRAGMVAVVGIAFIMLTGCAIVAFNEVAGDVGDLGKPEVSVNGESRGSTPITVAMKQGETYRIQLRRGQGEPRSFVLTNRVADGKVIVDTLDGRTPVLVEEGTGAWYPLNQESLEALLKRQQP